VHGFATLFLEGALAQMADGQSPAGFARQCSADMLRQLEGALVSAARAEPALESSLHATAISRRR
jgi:hypothetical protein